MAPSNACRIIGGPAFVEHLAALDRVVREIVALDHRVYEDAIHGHIGAPEQWLPIFQRHPDTWRALADEGGHVVAYWQIASFEPATFRRAQQGLLHPADLTCADYEALTRPGRRNLYFASVCIAPEWRTVATYQTLLDSFFGVVETLADKGVRFDEIAAVAHSDDGRQICVTLGLEQLGQAAAGGECYGGRFEAALGRLKPWLARRRPRVLELYGPAAGTRHSPPQAQGDWRLAARTKRHAYWKPSSNLPGVLLFALIALLGGVALAATGWKAMANGALGHDDSVLGVIGLFCLALGVWQGFSLARR